MKRPQIGLERSKCRVRWNVSNLPAAAGPREESFGDSGPVSRRLTARQAAEPREIPKSSRLWWSCYVRSRR